MASPSVVSGSGKAAPLARWLIAALLACALIPLTTVAQFTEVYSYVKTAVAVDRLGTLYFTHAETNATHAVVLSTAAQLTYALNESLSWPSGLVADADGSLLIADTGNHRIVRMNVTITGLLTAVYTTATPTTALAV